LVRLVQDLIPKGHHLDPIRDIQVLCPMNRGSIGVRELNSVLQGALNPARPGEPAVERFGWRFQVRDKVIQTENDYKKEGSPTNACVEGSASLVQKVIPRVTHHFSALQPCHLANGLENGWRDFLASGGRATRVALTAYRGWASWHFPTLWFYD
jgi:hypothetical protein